MPFTRAPISAVITDKDGNTINIGNASGVFTQAPTSIVITDANGNTLNVGPGVVAKVDLTAQQANISPTTLYTVPAGAGGSYRVTGYLVVTQAATTSSTLPNLVINYNDGDTNTSVTSTITSMNTNNAVGANSAQSGVSQIFTQTMNCRSGSVMQYQTIGYASVGATPMQYAAHIKLEYLGS